MSHLLAPPARDAIIDGVLADEEKFKYGNLNKNPGLKTGVFFFVFSF
jgi:hypothetical protein